MTPQQIDKSFTYHAPTQAQARQQDRIRDQAKGLAELLTVECPPGRELSLALTNLEQTVMWGNAAITRGGGGEAAVGAGGGARSGTGGAGGGGGNG